MERGTLPVASEDAVKEASEAFYDALNALFEGDVQPMEALWSHADDVTYLGPGGGIRLGWDEVQAEWRAQAAMKLGGHVTVEDLNVTLGADLAATRGFEVGENVVGGQTQTVHIRATNTFRMEDGQWKMIGHHVDPLAYFSK